MNRADIHLAAPCRWGRSVAAIAFTAAFLALGTIGARAAEETAASRPPQGATSGSDKATLPGIVEGTVTYQGEIPKSPLADDTGLHHDLLEVDSQTRGLQWVLIWLVSEGSSLKRQDAPSSSASEASAQPVVVDQVNFVFKPHLIAVRSGQPVKFINSDPANHNVRASSPDSRNEFNVFTGVEGSYTHRFRADPKGRPVRLDCDIHAWMRGWIYVFDHAWFAVTDAEGRFRIEAVPAGRYRLMIQQPDAGYRAERKITVAPDQKRSLEIQIRRDELPIK